MLGQFPDIAVDTSGTIHVVCYDNTTGWWESDSEIMYMNYMISTGWSNATIISDDATLYIKLLINSF